MYNRKCFSQFCTRVRHYYERTQQAMAEKLGICVRHLAQLEGAANYLFFASPAHRAQFLTGLIFELAPDGELIEPAPAKEP